MRRLLSITIFMSLHRHIIVGYDILRQVHRFLDQVIKWPFTLSPETCTSLAVISPCQTPYLIGRRVLESQGKHILSLQRSPSTPSTEPSIHTNTNRWTSTLCEVRSQNDLLETLSDPFWGVS